MSDTEEHDNLRVLNNSTNIPILNGVAPSSQVITPEWESEKRIAPDLNRNLKDHQETCENIIDSGIGVKNITRARKILSEHKLFKGSEGEISSVIKGTKKCIR